MQFIRIWVSWRSSASWCLKLMLNGRGTMKPRLQDWKRRFQFPVKAKCSSNRSLVEHSYISILLLECLCTCFTVTYDHGSHDMNEKGKKKGRKEKREKKKRWRRKEDTKNKGLVNKERKIEKEEKGMKGESFFKADKKGNHEKSSYEEGLTRWKKDARIKNVKNTRRFFFLNNEVNKVEDSQERETKNREKRRIKEKTKKLKKEGSSPETKFKNKERKYFSNVEEMKNTWYKNWTQKEMCDKWVPLSHSTESRRRMRLRRRRERRTWRTKSRRLKVLTVHWRSWVPIRKVSSPNMMQFTRIWGSSRSSASEAETAGLKEAVSIPSEGEVLVQQKSRGTFLHQHSVAWKSVHMFHSHLWPWIPWQEWKNEGKKGKKKRREKKKRYEKQGMGEQGGGEKLTKRREKMRGESFFQADQKKGDHGKIKPK